MVKGMIVKGIGLMGAFGGAMNVIELVVFGFIFWSN
jgi:hypothetical protein